MRKQTRGWAALIGAAIVIVLLVASVGFAQTATATKNAPIYLQQNPPATMSPMRVAAVGTVLKVVGQEGEWFQVQFEDPQSGLRTGWVRSEFVTITRPELEPMDLSIKLPPTPSAAPRPTEPTQPPATAVAPQAPPVLQAQAQEDDGGGFVIGFGGGYGWTNWKETPLPCYWYSCPPKTDLPSSHTGFASNFRIGAAINKRFLILFHSTSTFFNTENEGTVVDGMAGGDLQIHFGRKGRSFYVFGGAGYHNVMHFDFDDPYSGANSFGLGIRGGAGFEIVKYLTIEGHVQHGFNEAEHNPTSFAVTINFLKR